jgi:hypothetical protein
MSDLNYFFKPLKMTSSAIIKNVSHFPFGDLKFKLWPKEWPTFID